MCVKKLLCQHASVKKHVRIGDRRELPVVLAACQPCLNQNPLEEKQAQVKARQQVRKYPYCRDETDLCLQEQENNLTFPH
mmetsp:Transcript_41251/g.66917  ORF Transcript_41251/g.66917 Transcript_41251/m.66917 type:complete len:80 (+) Transcript_41251:183-422(+)